MEQFSIIAWLVGKLGLPLSWSKEYLHIVMSVLVFLTITIVSVATWRKLKDPKRRLLPETRGTLANIFEMLTEGLIQMMEDVMGHDAKRHLPLIGALFIYILVSNLVGAIPGLIPPTDNINTNFACAIVVFVYYNVLGIKKQGFKRYLKHLAGPILWLAPLMFAIELISHLVRPVSLSVRLFGNITGDHIMLGIFSQLVPLFVPIIFMGLTIFVAFIQAFVFILLSVVYITLATQPEH